MPLHHPATLAPVPALTRAALGPEPAPAASTGPLIAISTYEIRRLFALLTGRPLTKDTSRTGHTGDNATKHAPDKATTSDGIPKIDKCGCGTRLCARISVYGLPST